MAIWSKYNLFIPRKDGGCNIFNTRTGALVSLNAERYEQIVTTKLLDDDFYALLASHGFIVDEGVDELSLILDTNERARSSSGYFSATIELTESCNFSCKYCYQSHVSKHLDDQVAKRIVLYLSKKMLDKSHIHINWFGGEPLLRLKMLYAILDKLTVEANRLNCRLTQFLTTNGYLLSRKVAQSLAKIGIQNIQITVDGDESSHNQLRPLASGRGTYHKVMEACTHVAQANIDLMVRVNLNKFNANKIAKLLDGLLAVGITPQKAVIHVVRTINHGICDSVMSNACYTNAEFARKWIEILEEVAKRGFGLPTLAPIAYNCPFDLQQAVMIGYDGTIRHCSSSNGRLAEISDNGEEIGKTALFEKIKKRHPIDDENCSTCKYLPMCMGGCSYLREIGQESCNPERYVLGDLVALTVPIKGVTNLSTEK
jgi:uncharacterized protein